jgi:hypothetical protein
VSEAREAEWAGPARREDLTFLRVTAGFKDRATVLPGGGGALLKRCEI